MNEKLRMAKALEPLAHVASCSFAPPPRCHYREQSLDLEVCGKLATWFRPGRDWFVSEYFCDPHRGAADLVIPVEHVLRRVEVTAYVYFHGVNINSTIAHTEAVRRLERAVVAAGGLVTVGGVVSAVVKSPPLPPPRRAIGRKGRG